MNEVTVFENPEFGTIRTMLIGDEPWFVGKDVAERLGYANPQKAVRSHIDSEDRTVTDSFTVNGTKVVLINESGLYSLILSSKLPSAKSFKRWITSEVLPAIRKTGKYSRQGQELDVDTVIRCAELVCKCPQENKPEVIQILKKIMPEIESCEDLVQDFSVPTFDEDGCLIDVLGRRQPPRDGCKNPFDYKGMQRFCTVRKLTDMEIAKEIGCTGQQVYKWRTGKSKPTDFYRSRLCALFGVPERYFNTTGGKR